VSTSTDEGLAILALLHNLGCVCGKRSLDVMEISSLMALEKERVEDALLRLSSEGYVEAVEFGGGPRRFHLTARGVIRVCSIYT